MELETLGAILGSGTVGVVVTKLVEWRKSSVEATAKARTEEREADTKARQESAETARQVRTEEREADTKLVQDLRAMLQDERKLVQDERAAFHDERKGHLDCMDRVLGVERQLVDIQREHSECPGKISKLESQVEELRGLALERYTRSDPPPPSSVRG